MENRLGNDKYCEFASGFFRKFEIEPHQYKNEWTTRNCCMKLLRKFNH